jgi:hypothetical protein
VPRAGRPISWRVFVLAKAVILLRAARWIPGIDEAHAKFLEMTNVTRGNSCFPSKCDSCYLSVPYLDGPSYLLPSCDK